MRLFTKQLLARHDQLSLRERALVLLSVLALIYLAWDFALYGPTASTRAALASQLSSTQQKSAALAQEERVLLQAYGSDPDGELKAQLRDLEQRLTSLDENLSELSVGLVPVDRLASILQEVLARTGALQLHSLQTLPMEELQLTVKTGAEGNRAGVYKHSVAVTLKGSYFQVLEYLRTLENMHWRFYWDELRFEQGNYPTGLFELRVYTLSTEEGLFGV